MWELPSANARGWRSFDNLQKSPLAPRNIDVDCPNTSCGKSLVNIQLAWKSASGFLFAKCGCAACGHGTRFFLINAPNDPGSESLRNARLFQFPKPSIHGPFEDGIAEASPAFAEIHSQAQEAEGLGLMTLVGIGYRKALEFLIKDYLVSALPAEKDAICRMPLAQCIIKHVADPKVRMSAERATWLGNDETHYVRTWVDKDLHDLKVLIKLTQYWISSEILTAQYGKDMTKPKAP